MKKLKERKKKGLIAVILVSVGIAQFIGIYLSQSKMIWEDSGGDIVEGSYSSLTIQREPMLTGKYLIAVGHFFNLVGPLGYKGNVTLTHRATGTNYTLEYDLYSNSAYVEYLWDVGVYEFLDGAYNVSIQIFKGFLYDYTIYKQYQDYSTTADGLKIRLINAGLFRNLDDPSWYEQDNYESKWLLISGLALAALIIGSLYIIAHKGKIYPGYKY